MQNKKRSRYSSVSLKSLFTNLKFSIRSNVKERIKGTSFFFVLRLTIRVQTELAFGLLNCQAVVQGAGKL